MSVAQAQQQISSIEFTYWLAYLSEHCLDQEGWEQAGMICSVTANVQGAKTTPQDFIPAQRVKRKKQKQQTPQQMLQVMESMFSGRHNK
jgi:hypothetical protein